MKAGCRVRSPGQCSIRGEGNELLNALILTRTEAKTEPVVDTSFMSGYELPWGQIMATGTLVALPVIVFSMIVSRQLVRGLTAGAVK